jgi:hypothetical protein
MKKLTFCMMATFMLLSFIPAQVNAAGETKTIATAVATMDESAVAAAQLARLEEIKTMDLSMLSRSEKKELRNEVRAIKSDQDRRGRRHHDGRSGRDINGRHGGGSVVVMGGGGLLIILLIILLI